MKSRSCCAPFAAILVGILLASPVVPAAYAAPESGASTQLPPSQVYGKLLSNLETEIVSAAEAMPADKYNFAPTSGNFAGVRNFGEQVKHITMANYHILAGFGMKPTVDPKSIANLTTKDEIVKALQDSFAFAHRAFDTITPRNAFVPVDARQSTRAGIAAYMMVHANDHYGQMVEYLRMNGIIPPASRK